jgi:hypothetical protein
LRRTGRGAIVAAMRPRRPGSQRFLTGRGSACAAASLAGRGFLPPVASVRTALLAASSLLGLACGHPATRDDCEAIFKRSAEIELRAQNISDPKIIEERTAAVREARGKDLIDRCAGRRITNGALECVRAATTAAQVDRCLE